MVYDSIIVGVHNLILGYIWGCLSGNKVLKYGG